MDTALARAADRDLGKLPISSQCALYYPTLTSQLCTALNITPGCDAGSWHVGNGNEHTTCSHAASWNACVVIPTMPNERDSIDEPLQYAAVMHAGAGEFQRERNAIRIGEDIVTPVGITKVRF